MPAAASARFRPLRRRLVPMVRADEHAGVLHADRAQATIAAALLQFPRSSASSASSVSRVVATNSFEATP